MAKNLEISLLLDFYGEMLTEKQREVIELYYNEDLSLSEMAAYFKISRQGVRDNIKRAEATLLEFEEKLGLAKKFDQCREGIDKIISNAKDIVFYLEKYPELYRLSQAASEIIAVAKKINL